MICVLLLITPVLADPICINQIAPTFLIKNPPGIFIRAYSGKVHSKFLCAIECYSRYNTLRQWIQQPWPHHSSRLLPSRYQGYVSFYCLNFKNLVDYCSLLQGLIIQSYSY
jgi:hypothetical protein